MSDTPRTDAEYERLFEIYRNWERKKVTLCCSFENDMRLCRTLERELNSANQIIRQQQLLNEENLRLQDRIKRLEEAGDEMKKYCSDYYSSNRWRKAKEVKP